MAGNVMIEIDIGQTKIDQPPMDGSWSDGYSPGRLLPFPQKIVPSAELITFITFHD